MLWGEVGAEMTDLIKHDDALRIVEEYDVLHDHIKALPTIDPAAIREAALEDALVAVRQALVDGAYIYRGSHQEKPSNMLFVAERLVSKAINSLIGETK